jgi:hypothetical protein
VREKWPAVRVAREGSKTMNSVYVVTTLSLSRKNISLPPSAD